MRLSELPAAMRDHGVAVVEVAGCYGRGSAFDRAPGVGVDHWTVGAARGEAPSLSVVTYGRSDPTPLSGPLANVLRGRRVNGRPPRAFFIADGVSNNAGRGDIVTSSGRRATRNGDTFGLEVEYRPWDEPITDDDLAVDAAIHAAAAELCGYNADDVVGHFEWAVPRGRKTDRSTVGGPALRDLVRRELAPDREEDHMDWSSMLAAMLQHRVDGRPLTGKEWGVVAWWSDTIAKKAPGDRYGAYVWVLDNEPAYAGEAA